jgi:hypothetical protein
MKQFDSPIGNSFMKHLQYKVPLCMAALAILAGVGCRHEAQTRISTSTPERKMIAVFDEHAVYKDGGDCSLITFGRHQLMVQKECLILDDGRLRFGIPDGTKKIEIQLKRGVLTMSADGRNLLNTPI